MGDNEVFYSGTKDSAGLSDEAVIEVFESFKGENLIGKESSVWGMDGFLHGFKRIAIEETEDLVLKFEIKIHARGGGLADRRGVSTAGLCSYSKRADQAATQKDKNSDFC